MAKRRSEKTICWSVDIEKRREMFNAFLLLFVVFKIFKTAKQINFFLLIECLCFQMNREVTINHIKSSCIDITFVET